ncbi:MAG: magnesium-translocating P-type ATPase [Parachlamydiales bacterium]
MAIQGLDRYWEEDPGELLQALHSRLDGLSQEEASERLAQVGPNRLGKPRRHLLFELGSRLKNPLIILLLVAAAVSAALGEVVNALIVSSIILLSLLLDLVQEYHAGRAAERLKESVALRCEVVRAGAIETIRATELVPGDIVQVESGDLIPADGLLLSASHLFVNEASLTGESLPVEKGGKVVQGSTEIEASNVLLLGSSVISGTGRFVVVHTGMGTRFGKVAAGLQAPPPPSTLERGIHRLGLLLMRVALLIVPLVLIVNIVLARGWLTSLMFSVALAVGLTPELLPMIVSMTLARGALRMAKRRVIVKRLSSIEDFGSLDVLCTDKTGTLTQANLQLERSVDPFGNPSSAPLELAALNSHFQSGIRNPFDQAILQAKGADSEGWTKVSELPFDFERRRTSLLLSRQGEKRLITKGACEAVLSICVLKPEEREAIRGLTEGWASQGLRLLAIASAPHEEEEEMELVGFIAFIDPLQPSAKLALKSLKGSGIEVKIITGDNDRVTRHLCELLEMPVTGVLLGEEIERMTDSALEARVGEANLFCRVTPAQKNRIVTALKARGATVGFLGDGVNDSTALRSAHVGLSVATAVDVAREAADMILLERNLDVLHKGVMEGRRTFANLMKYILMGTSSNFGNMVSMAIAVPLLPFLPLLPVQVLLNNLLYDISQIPIPMDRVARSQLHRPRKWDFRAIRSFMLVAGPVSSLFDFATFALLIFLFGAHAPLFHTGWFIESLVTQVLVIFFIRTAESPWRPRPHPLLFFTAFGVLALAIALPYTPVGIYFGFVPLPPLFYGALAAIAATYFTCIEWIKRLYYRRVSQREVVQ